MDLFNVKKLFFLVILFISGCTSYQIPIQTDNHPASTAIKVSQTELSPILNIDPEGKDTNHDSCY